jgi:hypothetical protein
MIFLPVFVKVFGDINMWRWGDGKIAAPCVNQNIQLKEKKTAV